MSENAENLHSLLVRMLGFQFNENQLSPGLRSRLSQVNYEYSRWAHLEELRNEGEDDRKREGRRWWLPGLTIFVASLLLGIYMAFFSGMKSVDGSMDVGFLFATLPWGVGSALAFLIFALNSNGWYNTRTFQKNYSNEYNELSQRVLPQLDAIRKAVFNELERMWNSQTNPTITHVNIDFAHILSQLEGKGIWLQAIECPYCAAPLSLPSSGEYVKCKNCGRTVAATDVFDRIKSTLR